MLVQWRNRTTDKMNTFASKLIIIVMEFHLVLHVSSIASEVVYEDVQRCGIAIVGEQNDTQNEKCLCQANEKHVMTLWLWHTEVPMAATSRN